MSRTVSGELFDKYAEVLHEEQQLAIDYTALTKTMCSYINEKMDNPLPYFIEQAEKLEERRKELFQKYLDI